MLQLLSTSRLEQLKAKRQELRPVSLPLKMQVTLLRIQECPYLFYCLELLAGSLPIAGSGCRLATEWSLDCLIFPSLVLPPFITAASAASNDAVDFLARATPAKLSVKR